MEWLTESCRVVCSRAVVMLQCVLAFFFRRTWLFLCACVFFLLSVGSLRERERERDREVRRAFVAPIALHTAAMKRVLMCHVHVTRRKMVWTRGKRRWTAEWAYQRRSWRWRRTQCDSSALAIAECRGNANRRARVRTKTDEHRNCT